MKYILVILFLIPTLCFAQQKNDTKVIVSVSDTANLFNRLAAAFYKRGYTLETKDESVGFINTKEQEMKNYSPFQTIRAFISGNTITLTSKIRMGNLATFDVTFNNRKKNAFVAAWEEMEDLAKQFGNQITYSK
jgi:hypothetical protein